MIDPASVPAVTADELVARFILRSRDVRSDQTIKSDAFMPAPNLELSVTRLMHATEHEIWDVARNVAVARQKTLYGRGDVAVDEYHRHRLTVKEAPVAGNPNHANVAAWPDDKEAKKSIAQEIAAVARYVSAPNSSNS